MNSKGDVTENPMSGVIVRRKNCTECGHELPFTGDYYYCSNPKCALFDEEQFIITASDVIFEP